MKTYNEPVFISISNLNYNGSTTAKRIRREKFYKQKRWDGRFLVERISETKYKAIKFEEDSQEYSRAIQKKYNVGENWIQNRYFVEQVRPTLY